jgi:hypothetical protein
MFHSIPRDKDLIRIEQEPAPNLSWNITNMYPLEWYDNQELCNDRIKEHRNFKDKHW